MLQKVHVILHLNKIIIIKLFPILQSLHLHTRMLPLIDLFLQEDQR